MGGFAWAAGAVLGTWYLTIALFVALMHAKQIAEEAHLSVFWRVNLWPLAGVFLVLDIVFNLTAGTLMYTELPRELTFTSRCSRHKDGSGWRRELAWWWCDQLDQIDPGHC